MAGIFKAYDIRGRYPEEIDADRVRKIGYAFAQFLGKERIVVGHDMREASPTLARAFAEGVTSFGSDITNIGLAATPMLYHAIIDGGFDGGAMITASHLPGRYNGIKLCREKAIPLSGDQGLPDVERLTNQVLDVPPGQGRYTEIEFLNRYLDHLAESVEHPAPLKIVVDAGNGMGGYDTPPFFARFPVYTFVPMYTDLDGAFPNHVPNPALPDTTAELQQRVVAEHADLGIAIDGDGDRCGFIDETGERVPADLAIAVLAEHFLQKEPGATVLYDLRASRAVAERIREYGGNPVKTRVGHSFMKQSMRETNAVFAGELSGHYYFRHMGFTDSGIVSMITMLNLMAARRQSLSEMIRPLRKYVQSGEINIAVQDKLGTLARVEAAYSDGQQEHLDGLTVDYPNWWFSLRQSQTEPILRLVIETCDELSLELEKARLLATIGGNVV
ncbi:MAG: phosphomannomutase/phosphoglucomutase [Chloroflexi bacterium]|nr:phosphomannomutase/phosphoglucomutase [Chloroflexota bacterium]